MRYARQAAVAAFTMTALLGGAAPAAASVPAGGGGTQAASAHESTSGGAKSPSVSLAGGSEYGVFTSTVSTLRPVVSELTVPSIATAGRPPRVALRIDEAGVGTVNVEVTVLDLASRKPVIVVGLGWVHTGRTVTVGWPRGSTLKPGVYHVSVKAHDHHAVALLRRAHSSGVANLTVVAPANPSPSGGAVLEAGVPTPAQSAAAGAVFPVAGPHSFGGPENRFGAPRGSHTHQGQDVLTAEGTAIVAPLAGRIITTNYQAGGAGWYTAEHTDVGLDFMFAHCETGSLAVSTGQAVAAGQLLCQAGHTGDATTPHLHFEIWLGGWQTAAGHPIDPLPYLEAWDHTGAAG